MNIEGILSRYGLALKGKKFADKKPNDYFDKIVEKELSRGKREKEVGEISKELIEKHFASEADSNFLVVSSEKRFLEKMGSNKLMKEQRKMLKYIYIYYKNNGGGDVWGAYSRTIADGEILILLMAGVLESTFPNIENKMDNAYKMKKMFSEKPDVKRLAEKINEVKREVEDELLFANEYANEVREAIVQHIQEEIEWKLIERGWRNG